MDIKNIINNAKNLTLITNDEEVFDYTTLNQEEFINYGKASTIKKISNLLVAPILILHESLHLIFGLLFSKKLVEFFITSYRLKDFYASIEFDTVFSKSRIENILVNLSPLLIFISAIVLSFINSWFIIYLVYVIITYKYSFPSKIDILKTLLYKYEKNFDNSNQYGTFCSYMNQNYTLYEIIKLD
jgi:hypothetical protein